MSRKDERLSAAGDETWVGDNWRTKLVLGHCRTVPKFRGHGRLYKLMTTLLLNDRLSLRNVGGARLTIDSSDFIGWRMAYGGAYEPLSVALAKRIMNQGGTFIDVGSNVGLYSLSIAVIPAVRVVAIDASFTALYRLAENVRKNPDITNIEIVQAALGSSPGVHQFELPVPENLGTTRMATKTAFSKTSRFWSAGTTLQTVFDRLEVGSIRLLKIDVEGAELDVLKALDFSGQQRPHNIIMECEPALSRVSEPLAFLEEQGYVIRTVTGVELGDVKDLPEHNVWCRCRSES
jgi:FkbM family methyltransferase